MKVIKIHKISVLKLFVQTIQITFLQKKVHTKQKNNTLNTPGKKKNVLNRHKLVELLNYSIYKDKIKFKINDK